MRYILVLLSFIAFGLNAQTYDVITDATRSVFGIEESTPYIPTPAPVLTSPTDTGTGVDTGSGTVTTDTGNGTLYVVVTLSATPPSVAQIVAGDDNSGINATFATSQAVASTGVKNFSFTGLYDNTSYTAHYAHVASSGNSNVATADGFTTDNVTFGEIYNSGLSAFDAADLTFTGAGASVSGGNIVMTVGATNFTRLVTLTDASFTYRYHDFENWEQWVLASISARNGSSQGFGIGVVGDGSPNWSTVGQYVLVNTGDYDDEVIIYDNTQFTNWQRPDVQLGTVLINTDYWYKFSRNGEVFIYSLYASDKTTLIGSVTWTVNSGNTLTPSGTIGYEWGSWHYHKLGQWALWNFGTSSTVTIKQWTINIPDGQQTNKKPKWLFIGDSNTMAERVRQTDRYIQYIIDNTGGDVLPTDITVWAGGSNEFVDVQKSIAAIIDIDADNIVINLGSNDVATDGTSTAETRFDTFYDAVRTGTGANIYACTPIARDGVTFTTFNANVVAESSEHGYTVLDLWTLTQSGGNLNNTYDSGDNVHLNTTGHDTVGQYIIDQVGGL